MAHQRFVRTLLLLLLAALPLSAQTTNNDSSCDISVTPAATLLLPYFEVDFTAPPAQARTTLFTVVNTSPLPQIARATIWTDWAYPVMSFDLFLTGYDVASVNLYDVLQGRLPSSLIATPGAKSSQNWANPNHAVTAVSDCNSRPAAVSPSLLFDLRAALTTGLPVAAAACLSSGGRRVQVGSNHGRQAIGYITLDLVATCSTTLPTNARYFTSELLFDNVLLGDWMIVTPDRGAGNYAGGSPMVHIRAVPEGGPAGSVVPTPLPYTFHTRLTSRLPEEQRRIDRRQPLPSTFSARYIQGGSTDFQTQLAIWREAATPPDAFCVAYAENRNLSFLDFIRFDEHENATAPGGGVRVTPLPGNPGLPATSSTSSASSAFPTLVSPQGDIGGWLYLNLGRGNIRSGTVIHGVEQQAWVVVSMYAEGRFAQSFDAAALGNGCTPVPPVGARIGPRGEN